MCEADATRGSWDAKERRGDFGRFRTRSCARSAVRSFSSIHSSASFWWGFHYPPPGKYGTLFSLQTAERITSVQERERLGLLCSRTRRTSETQDNRGRAGDSNVLRGRGTLVQDSNESRNGREERFKAELIQTTRDCVN